MPPGVETALLAACALCAAGWWWTGVRLSRARAAAVPGRSPGTTLVLDVAEEAARFGLWELDVASGVVALSAGAARLCGLPPDPTSRKGEELARLIHPDDYAAAREAMDLALAGACDYLADFRCRLPDGSYQWRRQRGRVERIDRRVVKVIGVFIDVHDEKTRLKSLADKAARLSLAEDSAGLGTWRVDGATGHVALSPGAAALRGLPRKAVSLTVEEALVGVHPDDRAAMDAARERTRGGEPFSAEYRVVWPDGTERWMRAQAHFEHVDGQVVGMTGSVVDIDRERRMLEEMRDHAARMRLAEQAAGFGVTELDTSTGQFSFSPGWAALFGFDEGVSTMPLREVDRFIHPEDLPRLEACIEEVKAQGRGQLDYRVLHRDGVLRWHRVVATTAPRAHAADPVRLISAVIDVTREKHMLERLERAADVMRVAETVGEFGIWEVDVRADTLTLSEGMRALSRMPVDTPLSLPLEQFYSLLQPDDRAEMQARHRDAFAQGQPIRYERQWVLQDGSLRWHRAYARPEFVDGEPWRIVGTSMDVTVEKEMQISLEAARSNAEAATQAKSEFLASMSHEIRTPMNGVLGMTALLLETELSGEQREYAETLRQSGESLLSVIDDVLDFSKIEAGRLSIEAAEFDLCGLLEAVADMVALRAEERGIDLLVHYPAGAPRRFVGDQARLKQVVANLVSNAVKFTKRGHVLLSVDCDTLGGSLANVRVAVTDTGLGVPADKLGLLFHKFSQADASTTREFGGTGLGLAISKSLVELMGGTIGVESRQDHGSTFWFSIAMPLGERAAVAGPAALPPARRVLAVGCSEVRRRVLMAQLAAWGMRVEWCADPADASPLALAAQAAGDPFEVLIADVAATGADGQPLAATLKAEATLVPMACVAFAPVGFSKGHGAEHVAGVDARMTKPIGPSRLLAAVSAAWARHGQAPARAGVAPVRTTQAPAGRHASRAWGPTPFGASGGPEIPAPRILIAEDNFANQKVAVLLLNKLGVRVDIAENGVEALEQLMARPYDLVLMDLHMPEMNGYETAAAVRQREGPNQRVPIVAVTADVVSSARDRATAAGMDDFIGKPIHVSELERALRTWIRPERQTAALANA